MNCCCCCEDDQPIDVYVNNLSFARTHSQKQKFSFRTTATGSLQHSRASEASSYAPSHSQQQLVELQREYNMLQEEQFIINEFERNRLQPLQLEVRFYEREIQERTREINDLEGLFRQSLEEKQLTAGQIRPKPAFLKAPPRQFRQMIDETSQRAIPRQ